MSCADADPDCSWWADDGECEKNPEFMRQHCKKSCNVCTAAAGDEACEARFAASAAAWPEMCGADCDGYDITRYETTADALSAYAAYHAAKTSDPAVATLVFTPNQYGLGNRLRAMKSALLVAMLTGRVFRADWNDPYPLQSIVEPERIDWRASAGSSPALDAAALRDAAPGERSTLCLPFATAAHLPHCSWHMQQLKMSDLREAYAGVARLEVFVFTDLNIYLADNPHYAELLGRLGADCPKRMGCLFDFLFSPGPRLRDRLAAVLPLPPAAADDADDGEGGAPPPYAPYTAVQVRNRLWRLEAAKLQAANTAERVVGCLGRWVPDDGTPVFFTADDDALHPRRRPAARAAWGARFFATDGGVYEAWSRGGKVDPASLGAADEDAVLKAFADWFALRHASLLVWTYGSSFSKTAVEASGMPNIDVNHTRCLEDEATGTPGGSVQPSAANIQYDTSQVPGAKGSARRL